jgi:hypothetical protein
MVGQFELFLNLLGPLDVERAGTKVAAEALAKVKDELLGVDRGARHRIQRGRHASRKVEGELAEEEETPEFF